MSSELLTAGTMCDSVLHCQKLLLSNVRVCTVVVCLLRVWPYFLHLKFFDKLLHLSSVAPQYWQWGICTQSFNLQLASQSASDEQSIKASFHYKTTTDLKNQ